MRPSNKLLTFTVLASCFLSTNCSNRQSSTPGQAETNSTPASNPASSPSAEKATTPESVSRLEARVAEFEKRLAAVEAQLPRIAATTSGAPQVQPGQLSGGKLTNEKAMKAIKVVLPNCTLTLTGVQEMPQENRATARFNYSQCERMKGTIGAPDGQGHAKFTHYNDGRWVLTDVAPEGFGPRYGPLNIEAK